METKQITGKIEEIKILAEGKSFAYVIKGIWYSQFGQPTFKIGDIVMIQYIQVEKDGKVYNNIKGAFSETESKHIQFLSEIEVVKERTWNKVAEMHKRAYEEAREIIGREPCNDDMRFVNSMVMMFSKEYYFAKKNLNERKTEEQGNWGKEYET